MTTLENVYHRDFYARPTLAVARDLLGTILCRRLDDGSILQAPIVEAEAYTQNDPACHAARGLTPRCAVMFGDPGYAYVYFIYGMYFCLNVVTEQPGTPGAVLIRAVGGVNTNGPGKLCREWQITGQHNGVDLCSTDSPIWIASATPVPRKQVAISPRIGVTSAQDRMWRFYIKDHPSVSGPRNLSVPATKTNTNRRSGPISTKPKKRVAK